MKKYFIIGFIATLFALVFFTHTIAAEKPGPIMSGEEVFPDEALAPEYDFSGQDLLINITVYDTQKALNIAFVEHFKYRYDILPEVWGYYDIAKGVCVVHVLKLKDVSKDPQLSVWGHEMAHCIYGRYHQ